MGVIDIEDIVGVWQDDGRVLCANCMGEPKDYKQKDFIMQKDVEDDSKHYECDQCGETL